MRQSIVIRAAAIASIGALVAGCATNGQRNVFPAGPPGIGFSGPAHVDEIQDLTVPGLHNNTERPVRLRSVRIVGQPPVVRVLNVRAYTINMVGSGVFNALGDLPTECPGQFVPHPIGSFTIGPHKDSSWLVVVAFKISKPGIYHLRKLRVSYSTDGDRGWQYVYMDITSTVRYPPLPGPTPEPKSAVCGS
jgi:hypothetical protein